MVRSTDEGIRLTSGLHLVSSANEQKSKSRSSSLQPGPAPAQGPSKSLGGAGLGGLLTCLGPGLHMSRAALAF